MGWCLIAVEGLAGAAQREAAAAAEVQPQPPAGHWDQSWGARKQELLCAARRQTGPRDSHAHSNFCLKHRPRCMGIAAVRSESRCRKPSQCLQKKKKNNSPHCLQTQGCIKGSSDISEQGGRLCTGCRWGGIEFFCIRMSMERVVQNYFYPLLCLFFSPSWLIKGFLSLSEELLPISDDKLSSPVSARWCTLCWLFIIIFHGSSCWLPLPSLCFCLW